MRRRNHPAVQPAPPPVDPNARPDADLEAIMQQARSSNTWNSYVRSFAHFLLWLYFGEDGEHRGYLTEQFTRGFPANGEREQQRVYCVTYVHEHKA